jgi:apolipoprotein N-acyltransferase
MTRPRSFIVALFIVSALLGVLQAYVRSLGEDPRVGVTISAFAFAPLLFCWCKADAAYRGIAPPSGAPLLVGAFALVGVPYYFFRTRPLRQALTSTARAVGVFVLMGVTAGLTAAVVSHVFAS